MAQKRALTLDDALHRFRQHGFDLLIADASVASAEADVRIAKTIANPSGSLSVGHSFNYDPSQCAGCSNYSISFGVTDQAAISDALTGKRRLRIAVAQAAVAAAHGSRTDVERTLEFTLKQTFVQAEIGKRGVGYAAETARLSDETLELVRKRFHAGAISEADVARAEVQQLEAAQAVDSSRQLYQTALANIRYLLGDDSGDFDVADELVTASRPPLRLNVDPDALLRMALENRPDLRAARQQVQRATSALLLAKRGRIPDFLPSLTYSQEGSGQSAIQPPTLTFGVSANLPIFDQQQGPIAKAVADVRTQEATAAKVEAQIGSDVRSAVAALVSARARLARIEGTMLERARFARDAVQLQYAKGAASLFEALDAQRTLIATENEYLQNINDYWSAVFQLEEATGTELRQ